MTAHFHFDGQPLSNELVTSIANLFDAANIPTLLWGNYLLTIYGVPTVVDGASFIVPDALIEKAESVISDAGFLPCPQPSECPHAVTTLSPQPYTHLHINDELAVCLHRKSDLLWWFPDFEDAIREDNPDLMFACDERLPTYVIGRGGGRFLQETTVRHLSASKYCEAIIMLLCQDYRTIRDGLWVAILTYIMEFVDETDIFRTDELRNGYRQVYQALSQCDPNMYPMLRKFRSDLIEEKLISPKQECQT